jgi:hypothetical protein
MTRASVRLSTAAGARYQNQKSAAANPTVRQRMVTDSIQNWYRPIAP